MPPAVSVHTVVQTQVPLWIVAAVVVLAATVAFIGGYHWASYVRRRRELRRLRSRFSDAASRPPVVLSQR